MRKKLDKEKLINIGKEHIIDMLGQELVSNPSVIVGWWHSTDTSEKFFCVGGGVGLHPNSKFNIGDETPLDFIALVYINTLTGEVIRDYENSRLPL